jgi:hypothetical protein
MTYDAIALSSLMARGRGAIAGARAVSKFGGAAAKQAQSPRSRRIIELPPVCPGLQIVGHPSLGFAGIHIPG